METNQDFCVTCSARSELEHEDQWNESMADYAILLRAKEFGYADTINKIIQDWRTHALPICNPLALK